MQPSSISHATYVIERSYSATPERIFAAFADPTKKRRWYAEGGGRVTEEYTLDFRVGGNEHSSSRLGDNTPFPGVLLTNETNYRDIVPNRRIVMAYTMSVGDRRISASLATIELLPATDGTQLIFTDQAAFFEGSDGPQMREAGWRKLLEQLASELGQ